VSRLLVVRHAQTEWSRDGRHTGRTDIPLTESGREAAAALHDRLTAEDPALVLTSPLRRARETATLAGFEGAEPEPDIEEWNYGEYEGLTTPQIRETRPDWNLWRDGCPGGENAADVAVRVERVLARLPAERTALLFAHGHVLRVLTARWLALEPADGALFLLAPGGVGVLGYERTTRVLVGWS
jgi:probable phosphoglycerate mutase